MVRFSLKATFSTSEFSMLCFKCAVEEAQKGEDVDVEVDDYSSDYDTRSTQCKKCGRYV